MLRLVYGNWAGFEVEIGPVVVCVWPGHCVETPPQWFPQRHPWFSHTLLDCGDLAIGLKKD